MDKILEKANELKNALNNTKEFKEYLRVKELYETSDDVNALLTEMKHYKGNPEMLEKVTKEYNAHPLVVNYKEARQEVESILRVIKDILEKWSM